MHVLYIALIDGMETADTVVPSAQFPRYLQKRNSELLEQYQVILIAGSLEAADSLNWGA